MNNLCKIGKKITYKAVFVGYVVAQFEFVKGLRRSLFEQKLKTPYMLLKFLKI